MPISEHHSYSLPLDYNQKSSGVTIIGGGYPVILITSGN